MKRARRAKADRRVVRAILAAQAVEADVARAEDATVFQTRITVSRRGSDANRAGSFRFHGSGGRHGPGPSPHSAVRRAYDHNISETAERNEAHREAQNEGRE